MSETLELLCRGAAATEAAAGPVAALLRGGDVVLLDGDLGAGKTTFTQGLARALGVEETVTSPTFTLVHSYTTRGGVELYHVDVYRLDGPAEIADLGLSEMLDDGGAAVIEWGEKAVPVLRPDYLRVRLELTGTGTGTGTDTDTGSDGDRRLLLHPVGPAWQERWGRLSSALRPFAVAGGRR